MEEISININGNTYNINIIRKRVKRIILKVDCINNITITCSNRITYQEISDFINKSSDWLIKSIKKNKHISDFENDVFYLFGKKYNLVKTDLKENDLLVKDDNILYYQKFNTLKFKNYYSQIVEKRFFEISLQQQLKCNLIMKKYKNRWGCCNPRKKTVCLNVDLVCLPQKLIDYVIYHELTHFKQFNHQKAFYAELEKICPDYKRLKKEIKEYSFVSLL